VTVRVESRKATFVASAPGSIADAHDGIEYVLPPAWIGWLFATFEW